MCRLLLLLSCATCVVSLRRKSKQERAQAEVDTKADWWNVCYFTNWARYRSGLINRKKDVFEMGNLDPSACTHFMYGFATVTSSFQLRSNDPNADHPSGNAGQNRLCPEACNDPNFQPNWSDPGGERCQWPCSATRELRGYEGLNVGMRRKNPAIKSLISVGGWNFNDCNCSPSACFGQGSATCEIFSTIAASEASIRTFASNIIDFCRRWGFDGFDLDWEYPVKAGHNSNQKVNGEFVETPQDYVNYITMLRILKEEFQKEGDASGMPPLLLTAAVGVGKPTIDVAYDVPGMSKYLDMINLMTYDLHGGWEDRTGHNAPLYATAEDEELAGYPLSVSWAVDYWLQLGASPSQVTIGLATYGRGWKLADSSQTGFNAPASGKATPGVSTKEAGYLSYYEVEDKIAGGAKVTYDAEREGPYIVSGGEWVGYDNQRSFCTKLQFGKSRNLAGSMIWALDLDDFAGRYGKGEYPLVRLAGSGGAGCSSSPTPTPPSPTPTPPTPPTPTPTPPTPTPTPTPPTPTPTPTPPTPTPTPPTGGCEHEKDCSVNPWCRNTGYEEWCRQQGQTGACPAPYCKQT